MIFKSSEWWRGGWVNRSFCTHTCLVEFAYTKKNLSLFALRFERKNRLKILSSSAESDFIDFLNNSSSYYNKKTTTGTHLTVTTSGFETFFFPRKTFFLSLY